MSFPNGWSILMSGLFSASSSARIFPSRGILSTSCLPSIQHVWRLMFETSMFPRHEAGLMWSIPLWMSRPSFDNVGNLRRRGERSHSGCWANIAETLVVPVRWIPSWRTSMLVSFPVIMRTIPNLSSSQSVPITMIQNFPVGLSTLVFATQK